MKKVERSHLCWSAGYVLIVFVSFLLQQIGQALPLFFAHSRVNSIVMKQRRKRSRRCCAPSLWIG